MNVVFADTSYYLALTNPNDDSHERAREYTAGFAGRFLTTAWILTELANALARAANRPLFLALAEDLQTDARVSVVPPSQDLFNRGLDLYARRPDKDWSLTDCISFVVMRRESVTDALTADHHFRQARFTALLL